MTDRWQLCPDPPLEVAWHAEDHGVVVVAAGDVDMDTADQLSAVITTALDAGGERLIVDLSRVGFFGSAGVRVLAEQHAQATAAGCRIELHGVSAMVARVLEISGVLEWFEVTESPAGSSRTC
jgi:anti-anti-sigma factor